MGRRRRLISGNQHSIFRLVGKVGFRDSLVEVDGCWSGSWWSGSWFVFLGVEEFLYIEVVLAIKQSSEENL